MKADCFPVFLFRVTLAIILVLWYLIFRDLKNIFQGEANHAEIHSRTCAPHQ